VAVGRTGVAVGGTGVAVGRIGVAIGGMGVVVGGTGVAVGGTGVAVGGSEMAVGGRKMGSDETGSLSSEPEPELPSSSSDAKTGRAVTPGIIGSTTGVGVITTGAGAGWSGSVTTIGAGRLTRSRIILMR
jgi:hypothetical protein